MKIIIVNSNPIHKKIEEECKKQYSSLIINDKKELRVELLKKFKPTYLFFLHWSSVIPKEIYENYNCVVFHMTDLPYGRGGSPLQNLIIRGHKTTKITAIKVEQGLDTGLFFLKKNLSLKGTAEQIFIRTGKTMLKMIHEIISKNPAPKPQMGKVVVFKRRTPDQSDLKEVADLATVHDMIRMLDAEGYPKAYIESANFKFEFTKSKLDKNVISAQVKIIKKT